MPPRRSDGSQRARTETANSQRTRGRPAFAEADRAAADRFERASRRIQLDTGGATPLWRQLAEQLEQLIRAGRLQPRSRMPSELALAGQFGVSRPVVRNALQALVGKGLVVKLPRKGIFVGELQAETTFISSNLATYDDLVARGHRVEVEDFEQYACAADADEQHHLRLGPGDSVVRIGRVFWMDGLPISHASISFTGAKVPGFENVNLENRPILRTVWRRYGRRLARAERWLKATTPPRKVAERLRVTSQTPLIWIESVAYEADNTPLEYYRAYYNSDAARVHISVTS